MCIGMTKIETDIIQNAETKVTLLKINKYRSLFLFNDLIHTIRNYCHATIESEAGGAVHNEWLIKLKSNNREVNAYWNMDGISFSAADELGREFLLEVGTIISGRRYMKPKLLLEEILG
jgi:hypothetical protein